MRVATRLALATSHEAFLYVALRALHYAEAKA